MAGALSLRNYVSDDGNTYVVRIDTSNAVAVSAAAAAAGSRPNLPHGYRMRYLLAKHPTTGRERRIHVNDPSVALWVGGASTISLVDYDTTPAAAATYTVSGRVGEKRYAK
jgi:hypothetical protein